MENANFWDDPNNYSLFMLDEELDLFGDPNLGSDLDLFGDASLDLALDDISLPVLDYSSTIQNGALMPSPALDLPSGSDISDPVVSAHRDNVFQIPRSSDVQPQSSLWTQDTPKDSIPQSTISITDRDESPSSTTSDRESLKRRIAESVVVFSATSDLEIKPRKRKAFSKSRKEEVALNRLIGACIQCKIKKNACTFGLPCNQCIKRAGSAALGQVLCMRQSLLATRFDHIDLFTPWLQSVSKDVENSKTCPPSESSYLYFPGSNETPEAYIKVRLIDFELFGRRSSRLIISMDYFGASISEVPDRRCAIHPRDLPSIRALLRIHSVNKSDAHPTTGPFFGLQKAVRSFAEAYCENPEGLPLRTLLEKSLRIQQLFHIYRFTPLMKSSMQSSEEEMLSSTILAQIRHLLVEELIPLEVQMFSALENLIYDKDGIGKQNPLATWACLWTLIFTYKEHMVFYTKPLSELKLMREARYHLNKHIYNTLTSMYAALYKTTSPLTFDWRTTEISDMLGRDPELIRLFNDIKTEMYWFHAARDSLLEEDSLFKSLVVENESKLVSAHIKAAKKKGIL
ncbi:hypothetical protein BKA61DRAFT_262953 [Leptodontidium sp. MPI-SDFR-AT-0119]|nr:hypothetical protein BKA61DRAFT_262953 [Leptodontidium sp. MPI-SDFR-AT-0119]